MPRPDAKVHAEVEVLIIHGYEAVHVMPLDDRDGVLLYDLLKGESFILGLRRGWVLGELLNHLEFRKGMRR